VGFAGAAADGRPFVVQHQQVQLRHILLCSKSGSKSRIRPARAGGL
jgi:hypothetical protein